MVKDGLTQPAAGGGYAHCILIPTYLGTTTLVHLTRTAGYVHNISTFPYLALNDDHDVTNVTLFSLL